MVEKPLPDPFLENQNSAYLWINSLKLYTTCFYYMPIWGLFQHIETETTPQTQNASWTYIRRSEDVLDVFWTSCVRSVYVLCRRGIYQYTDIHWNISLVRSIGVMLRTFLRNFEPDLLRVQEVRITFKMSSTWPHIIFCLTFSR